MEFIDNNVWIPVHTLPGYECCIEYYVNNQGEVKSTKGTIERILKPKIAKTGYPVVNLTQRIGRKKLVTVPIHTLVAFAFLGAPPTPYGKKKDAQLSNTRMDAKQITMQKIFFGLNVHHNND